MHYLDTGDIFAGYMIYGVLESGKIPEELSVNELISIAESATRFAGLSTQKYGGISSIPDKNELDREGSE
jgi:fructokinase